IQAHGISRSIKLSRHCDSKVDLPKPAGATMQESGLSSAASSVDNSRLRSTNDIENLGARVFDLENQVSVSGSAIILVCGIAFPDRCIDPTNSCPVSANNHYVRDDTNSTSNDAD
ncbi:MAG: hypothetical protein AAFW97_17035, partial [Pseudomonadota bacterium]